MLEGHLIKVPIDKIELQGDLTIPKGAQKLIIFAHGSGSSRKSPRNQHVANILQRAALATLLIDLLTIEEERFDQTTALLRFDIPLLAQRLSKITSWIESQTEYKSLKIGYFGASTGAAAALIAAAQNPKIFAVVSRGGRPDLAKDFLKQVKAPTLFIVGGYDTEVIRLNEEAIKKLTCEEKIVIIEKATHLFEEKGALDEVATVAKQWFETH